MRLDLLEGVRTLQWSGHHSSHASGITDTLIESAQHRWRAVNTPHLVALVRAGASSRTANSSNDPTNHKVISKPRDQGGHETGRHVAQRELPGQVRLLDGVHGRT